MPQFYAAPPTKGPPMIRKLLAAALAALALTAAASAPAEAGRDTTWGTVQDSGQ